MTQCSDTKLRWEDGVPVSTAFDDPYFSRENGLAETRHVFLNGNDLQNRFAEAGTFHVAELGFGTGLNLVAALQLWRVCGAGTLVYTAFEQHPLPCQQMVRAIEGWPELSGLAAEIAMAWKSHGVQLPDLDMTLVIGDARAKVPEWQGRADAWFLDGFAPARNPEMWETGLLAAVHATTQQGGTFATYSAAGAVRRALIAAGFAVRKVPGYGRKREMLVGQR